MDYVSQEVANTRPVFKLSNIWLHDDHLV